MKSSNTGSPVPLQIPKEFIKTTSADHPEKEASRTSKTEHAKLEEQHGAQPSQSTSRGTRAPASAAASMKRSSSDNESPSPEPLFPGAREPARNTATGRRETQGQCDDRPKLKRGWRMTTGQLQELKRKAPRARATLSAQGLARNPATKRSADASLPPPKRLMTQQPECVAGGHSNNQAAFNMPAVTDTAEQERGVSPSPDPCMQKRVRSRDEERRPKLMRGWRLTTGQLRELKGGVPCSFATLSAQGLARNPARKRAAEASPLQPKRLKSQQSEHVEHQDVGNRRNNTAVFNIPAVTGSAAPMNGASPSLHPRTHNRVISRYGDKRPQLMRGWRLTTSQLQELKRKAPRPCVTLAAQGLERNKAKKRSAEASPPPPKMLRTEEPVEKHIERLAQLGVPLLTKEQVKEMVRQSPQCVGRGMFGSCYKGVDPRTGEEVVVKVFKENAFESLMTEAVCLQQLHGCGVQRLVGVCVQKRQLVTRFAGETAKIYFQSQKPLRDTLGVIRQVARAVQGIHQAGFAHNDIKCNNVCVKESCIGPMATVIDLGMAKPLGTHDFYTAQEGENVGDLITMFPWIAPELLLNSHPCSQASDVYSMAWVVLQVPEWQRQRLASPTMWALWQWVQQARQHHPEQRPSLEALVLLVEQLRCESPVASG